MLTAGLRCHPYCQLSTQLKELLMTGFTVAWNILIKIKYTRKKHYPSNLPVKVLATLDFTNLSVNISTLKLVLANVKCL